MRIAAAVLVLSASAWAQAQTQAPVPAALNDVMQARAFAMGGAYRGVGYGSETISGNPALLSMYRRYQMEIGGAWDIPNGYGYGNVSIVDSISTEVAMGISYTLLTFDSPYGRNTAHLNSLALSYPITDWLHFGLSGRHQLIYGPYETNSVTMGLGVAVRLFDLIILGFSAHNLISVSSPLVNRYFAFAATGQLGAFTPTFEMRMDFNAPYGRFAFAGGVEYIAAEMIPLRAGFVWDGISNVKYLSFGTGFFVEGSGVDIAYRHEIGGFGGRLLALTVKMHSG